MSVLLFIIGIDVAERVVGNLMMKRSPEESLAEVFFKRFDLSNQTEKAPRAKENRTTQAEVKKALSQFENDSVIGIIMNKSRSIDSSSEYGYYY